MPSGIKHLSREWRKKIIVSASESALRRIIVDDEAAKGMVVYAICSLIRVEEPAQIPRSDLQWWVGRKIEIGHI